MYREIPERFRALIEPVVEDHGCELVDVEVQLAQTPGMVRVIVDNLAGDGRVPVEVCAAVSRELGVQFDAEDLVPGRYRLEVSSPGLDRRLAREKDFAAAQGREVKIQTKRPLEGRRRFRGRLVSCDAVGVRIAGDGRETEIPFAEIKKANAVYQFSRADFDSSAE